MVSDFVSPLRLAKKPRILAVALATAITFYYGSSVPVIEIPLTFGDKFGLNAQQTGLHFIPIITGSALGEQVTGPTSDNFIKVF